MANELWCARALLADGWADAVRMELDSSGCLRTLAPGAEAAGARRLEGWVLPGMPNLHSHGFQRALAGLTGERQSAGDDFWSWRQAMYALVARVDPETLEALLAGLYADMLAAGYTGCAEFHYLHHGPDGRPYADRAELSRRVLRAARAAGMPLTLLPVWYRRAGFDADDVAPEQVRFRNDFDEYLALLEACRKAAADENPRARVGAAPHSLRAVPPSRLAEWLTAVEEILPAAPPIHMHVAEQRREVEECRARLGAAPLAWLLDELPVNRRWCLVHATHSTPRERAGAAARGAVAGLCPSTEADLGDGLFDAVDWLARDGAFGVGSDSNLRLDAAGELRLLEYGQRLRLERRNVLAERRRSCGRRLYEDAARGGARALGQPTGSLAPGLRADLVELDPDHPLLQGLEGDQCLDAYLFAGGPAMIRSVWVAGRERVNRDGHFRAGPLRAAQGEALGKLRR